MGRDHDPRRCPATVRRRGLFRDPRSVAQLAGDTTARSPGRHSSSGRGPPPRIRPFPAWRHSVSSSNRAWPTTLNSLPRFRTVLNVLIRSERIRATRQRNPLRERAKQRVTTPLLLQTHATECGAASLGSVLAYFGRWVPLIELRGKCEVSRDGSTAAGIVRAAKSYGLECQGLNVHIRQLKDLSLPLIVFWEFNHFLVLEGYDRKFFYLNDPATGRRKLSAEEFEPGFSGIVLQFKPGPEFQRGGVRPNLLERILLWLRDSLGTLAYAFGCGLMLAMLALVTPAIMGIFVDRVLGENEPWGRHLAGTLAAAAILVYGLTWLKQWCLHRLSIKISIIAGNRCLSKLLWLPIEYFNHRLVGELTDRVLSIDKIAKGLSEHFLGVLIEITMSVVFLAVMVAYDPTLALIVLSLAMLNGLLMRVITRIQTDESHAWRREQGLLVGVGMLMMNQKDRLRMNGEEGRFFTRWSGHQARELAARQRFSELSHFNEAMPNLFMILGHGAVLTFGATQVMAGELTLGALVAFYLVAAMFLEPVGRFVELADKRQALEANMQRLDDIMEIREDPRLTRQNGAEKDIATFDGRLRLTGHVEMRSVTFGYNRGRPPLIKDFCLTIKPGQRVAVVGPSGSGKSTLSRLISGLYQPWSGEILFDGRPGHEIPVEVLSRSLSLVDQHCILFSATVRENITLWNPSFPDEDVVNATRDACIHDEILSRPLGYATRVVEDGGNFSGGQRQRLEIARALVGNPTVLVLDEATSALDAVTEKSVDEALRRRGCSCLIVAHRLSTVRDCDEIIVLDKGVEVQRGAHDELMKDETGLYYRLIQEE
ncbi:MAG: NHLP family bacteriocin export ABC transporter peptidase/permease/ATPase subunit [Nitrospira sp. SB0677_bin_15]|nr:NHLP family bacteriocin export ABC transporter peptidase/permease/ATPase subunit [Nitrospira sp. SB0677_bin_15]MYH01658.1 NHLP family bacteriocin export ABC transporter peptidase/permease/ATPase subunit [Nitrospira sp. SB0675_bin_23]